MTGHRVLAALAGAVSLAAAPCAVLGNGGYVPEIAFRAMPQIPLQRALIVYRDGVETLIVESTFDSESPGVGWILPLPAEPTEIDVADPGMLTTMAVCLGPEVIHDLHDVLQWAFLVLIFLVPLALKAVLFKEGVRLLDGILWLIVCLLFVAMLGHAGAGGAQSSNVTVLSTQKVGGYDVSVLRAGDPGALAAWLSKEGLTALSQDANAIVGEYIEDGWCFAVARLRRETKGAATPHPLRVTFPAEKPVYPMRMTRIAGTRTHVELFVVAEQMAVADGFHVVSADRYAAWLLDSDEKWLAFRGRTGGVFVFPGGLPGFRDRERLPEDFWPEGLPAFSGTDSRAAFGQPGVVQLLWDGCVVTRLEADLSPDDMQTDVWLGRRALRVQRDRVFSPRGRWQAAVCVLAWGGVGLALNVIVLCNKRRRPGRAGRWTLGILLGLVLFGSVAAALSHRVVAVGPSVTNWQVTGRQRNFGIVANLMVIDGVLHAGTGAEELATLPEKIIERDLLDPDALVNPFTGARMRYERSPGNFYVQSFGQDRWLCLYDRHGFEMPVAALPPPSGEGESRPQDRGAGRSEANR
jgi:hypothetical protein